MIENKVNIFFYYLILFLVYTQGFWERFTFFPAQLFLEICVLIIAVTSFRPLITKPLSAVIIVICIGFISAIATSSSISYCKSIRYILYFFIIYNMLWNTTFTIGQFNKLIKFITGLILLQGIASIYQAFIIGDRVEGYVGFMSSIGGTTATAFPIFVIGILTTLYLFSNQEFTNKYTLYLILCIISVCLVGYSSGKRAIYFFIPFILITSFIISSFSYNKLYSNKLRSKLLHCLIASILIFPIYISGISTSRGLNYNLQGTESNIDILNSALEYTRMYETSYSGNASIGRSNSTMNIIKQAFSSTDYLLVGSGFGSIKEEDTINERNIGYGFVGFTRDVFSGGFIYALAVAFLFVYLFFFKDTPSSNITQAIRWIILITFVTIHFTYSSDFTVHLKLTAILSLLLCLLNSHNYENIRQYYYNFLYI